MTEKRFIIKMDRIVKDKKSGKGFVFSWQCDAEDICDLLNNLNDENQQLKEKLYVKEDNTMKIIKNYSKQFKRHSAQFSFMMDLAEDLGVDVMKLEALDD